jgi:hypothetical protein
MHTLLSKGEILGMACQLHEILEDVRFFWAKRKVNPVHIENKNISVSWWLVEIQTPENEFSFSKSLVVK